MLRGKWSIRLLGGLVLEQGGQVVSAFRTRKTSTLLATLAYRCPKAQSREELADSLWPEMDLESSQNSLRVTISYLRREIEFPGAPAGRVLIASRSTLALKSEAVVVDVHEFETALLEARSSATIDERRILLQKAISVYRGDLLPGHYEDWVVWERERLRQAYLTALRQLTAMLRDQGQYDAALHYALKAVCAEPLDEDSHAAVLRLYLASGKRADALKHFVGTSELFLRELEHLPSPDLATLVEGLDASPLAPAESGAPPARIVSCPGAGADERAAGPAAGMTPPDSDAASTRSSGLLPNLAPFFGRESELVQLGELLNDPDVRLLTLIGPGGVGKTRLASELARRAVLDQNGEAWFVPLADHCDSNLLMEAIAGALSTRPSSEAHEDIVGELSGRRTVLVLDNFEQLIVGGAEQLVLLLEHLPLLTCIVTSRQALEIPGEQEFPLQPLPVPAEDCSLESLAAMDSVRLFLDRARRVRPDFPATGANAGTLAAIVRRLDGIPLAIELAASWATLLSPQEMLEQLSDPLCFLVSRRRGVPERHRTLRATLDRSFGLLTPSLQRFFGQLSVFRGGCTLEAVVDVCSDASDSPGDGPGKNMEVLDFLRQLVSSSLLQALPGGSSTRYRMLETNRDYASRQVPVKDLADLRRLHARHYKDMVARYELELMGSGHAGFLVQLDAEQDNIRSALEWCLESDRASALWIAHSLCGYWHLRGRLREGTLWLQRALEKSDSEDASLRSSALNAVGILWTAQGRETEAAAAYEESLALARTSGDPRATGGALGNLAMLAHGCGETRRAQELYRESLGLFRGAGYEPGVMLATLNLGGIKLETGAFKEAGLLLQESLELSTSSGNTWVAAAALHNLGDVELALGKLPEARSCLEESLRHWVSLGEAHSVGITLRSLGSVLLRQDLAVEAVQLFGAADAARASSGAAIPSWTLARYEADVAASRQRLGDAWQDAFEQGRRTPAADALAHLTELSIGPAAPARKTSRDLAA